LLSWISSADFDYRLTASLGPREAFRTENWLCVVRSFLALCFCVWVRLVPLDPALPTWHGHVLLIATVEFYFLYSWLMLVLLHVYRAADSIYCLTAFVIDLFAAAAVTAFAAGPETISWPIWLFVVLTAAYRWSFLQTLLTAVAGMLFLAGETFALRWWPQLLAGAIPGSVTIRWMLLPCAFLFALSLPLGFLAVRERQLRAESALVARVLGHAQVQGGIDLALEALFAQLVPLFLPFKALIALREGSAEEVFSWQAARPLSKPQVGTVKTTLQFSKLETAAFSLPAHSWYFTRSARHPDRAPDLRALDALGKRMRKLSSGELLSCLPANEVPSLMVSSFSFGEDRSGRLILVGPSVRGNSTAALHFLQRLMRKIGPAVPNICFLRDIRKQTEDQVRARLVRELHDGTIQSLLSAEMQIEVLRRQNRNPLNEADLRLTSVQNLIHQEAVNLRDLIEGTKPLDFAPHELPNYLTDLVMKFRRETGISVRLELAEEHIDLPPGICHEIVRIVQEGLSNARKHSGARNIVVTLCKEAEGQYKLSIADDGQGFGFRGRVTQSQLDATHRGPGVIKERVRLIGGELTIDSSPGHGARLEITIPDESHA
jgi:signal transduction histidine kinase